MADTSVRFRFPSPKDERIILVVLMIVAVAWVPLFLFFAGQRAEGLDASLAELIADTRQLRLQIAVMVGVVVTAVYAGTCFLAIKSGTTITIDDEWIAYRRPGVPGFGLLAKELRVSPQRVDRVAVESVVRGTVSRVEVRIEAGRDEIRCNLSHAIRDGETKPLRLKKSEWGTHPLVAELARVCNKQPSIL